jgi:hypothetical protein
LAKKKHFEKRIMPEGAWLPQHQSFKFKKVKIGDKIRVSKKKRK